jgi:hypothetical protein
MELTQARVLKDQLADFARDLAERHATREAVDVMGEGEPGLVRAPTLSLGLAPRGEGDFAIAVRYRLGVPTARSFARQVAAEVIAEVGDLVDVRRTGRIHLAARRTGTRQPVATARAVGETGRVRPLRPGVSIAHVDVTAGTLGAFVVRVGPADGGTAPDDRVGTLAQVVPLTPGGRATADAALALLDAGIATDPTYPVGRVTTTAEVTGGETVAKIGRTTALTEGRVTAIELDDVVVGYGPELGALTFDGQIEVEGAGDGPFSLGGDSGSLVYREDGAAVGLLFAGSETGGSNGRGLTYCNPIGVVLDALGVALAG